jgi:flavin-dependent dehydrogenase
MRKTYDVAVLGATAAGYVAALELARQGHSAIVLDVPRSGRESPLADWLPADVFEVCRPLRAVKPAGLEGPFRAIQFHSDQLDREALYRQRATAGFVLRSARLLRALGGAARRAGIDSLRAKQAPRHELQESAVALEVGGQTVRAALLLIAQDSPADVIAGLRLSVRSVPTANLSLCGLDAPMPRGQARRNIGGALHLIAFGRGEQLGMFFAAGAVLHVRIISGQAQAPADVEALSGLIGRLQRGGLLPQTLDLSRAVAAIWRPPGGVALELETHLAKRTLLVGTAGGFASAMTGQTLDPSIRSAMVAADVAARALKASQPQEVLADYKSQWRDVLADRIRPAGTSLQMLMPMVLANKAMAERFARAFLYGENI